MYKDTVEHARRVAREELGGAFGRHRLGAIAAAALPNGSAFRVRAEILKFCGWPIGSGASLASVPKIFGSRYPLTRLHVGDRVFVNVGAHWELNDRIDVGDDVSLGHEVMLLTTSHRIGDHTWRASGLEHAPIRIGAGAWIGSRSIVLPGVSIGDGAIVAAGTVVRRDVPSDTIVGVESAGIIRRLVD